MPNRAAFPDSTHDVDPTELSPERGRGLGRAVAAAVVDDEDVRVGERGARAAEDRLDVGALVERRDHDERAWLVVPM